jgi:hypothetical protein
MKRKRGSQPVADSAKIAERGADFTLVFSAVSPRRA